jgi:ADP-ribose pyrophosphatase
MTKIKPWQILESHITYQDKFIKLRTDRCLSSRGNTVERYHVLEYNDWVNAIVLTPNFDCVVLQEYRHGVGGVRLGLPSGGVDDNETDFLGAIKREVLEESGYTSEKWFATSSIEVNPGMQNNKLHSFLACNAVLTSPQDLEATEDIEVSLMPFAELLRGVREGKVSLQSLYIIPVWAAVSFILKSEEKTLEPLRLDMMKELKL